MVTVKNEYMTAVFSELGVELKSVFCVEQWCGITDNVSTDKNIKTKEGINSVAPNDIWTIEHSFEILK